jgi:tetratricopeptide (TPR) repeat protein
MFRFQPRPVALVPLLLSAIVSPLLTAQEPKKVAPTGEQIAQWIRDLGNDDFDKRQNASKQLWEAGRAAEAPLKETLKSDDREVIRRSRELLEKLRWGLYPDTPRPVAEMIGRYQDGATAEARGEMVQEFLTEGADGHTAFARISAAEDREVLVKVRAHAAQLFLKRGIEKNAGKDPDQAFQAFDEAVRLDPQNTLAFTLRGWALAGKGSFDRALKDLDEAIRLEPLNAVAFAYRGAAWCEKKDYTRALEDLDKAVRINPLIAYPFYVRAHVWSARGDHDRTLKDLDEAIRIEPENAEYYFTRGITWNKKKDYERTLKDYSEAIRLDPRNAHRYNAKAWVLGACPEARYRDGKTALELATRACELTEWKDPYFYDVLAVAHAELGEFDKAVEWVEKALKDRDYEKRYGDQTRERLRLFKDSKPWRDK